MAAPSKETRVIWESILVRRVIRCCGKSKRQEVAEECRRVRRFCGQGKKEQDVCKLER
jgi:hypothetical protein